MNQIILTRRSIIKYLIIVILHALVIGFSIGYYGFQKPIVVLEDVKKVDQSDYDLLLIKENIKSEMSSANIRNFLKHLTKKPHVAGSTQDEVVLVDYVKSNLEKSCDKVETIPYYVLLSYPNETDPNYLSLISQNGSVLEKSNYKEPQLAPNEDEPVIDGFNSYSPAGHVKGKMVYVNYAGVDDFEYLQSISVNVSGHICISRYGKQFRGDKATNAETYGCIGLVMYTDPADYGGYNKHSWSPDSFNHGYPNSWWMPDSGFQRGSLHMGGDPETIFYPSYNFTYRDIPNHLPKIPVQPISYADAYKFLSVLSGEDAPDHWQGGFNLTYKLGPLFKSSNENSSVELHVGNYVERKTIYNVIGYIYGSDEVDRYVMFGNHRDAWDYGGADPSSGTAVLLEVARAFGIIKKKNNWRPKRTVVFCNWGAEEHGLIGSTEWVEEYEKTLIQRGVVYINIDIAVQGNSTFRASATPTLYQLLFTTTQAVSNPNEKEKELGRPSVYDTWLYKLPDENNSSKPFIRNLGSGSDYTMFVQRAGISSIDMRYTFTETLSSYPVYHSLHDTFEYFDKFLDNGFKYSLAMAEISVELIVELSTRKILPLQVIDYPLKLKQMTQLLQKRYGSILESVGISLNPLLDCIKTFEAKALIFHGEKEKASNSSDKIVRQLNDRLYYIDRAFIDFQGLFGRSTFRHVIFAPGLHDRYGGSGFPGVADALFEAVRGSTFENVKKQLSILCVHILSAVNIIELS